MAIYKTTKAAYEIDLFYKDEADINKFYKVMKNRVFLTKYAFCCGYLDIQETNEGSCIIERTAPSFYAVTYYDKNDQKIGYETFETMSEAGKNLIFERKR